MYTGRENLERKRGVAPESERQDCRVKDTQSQRSGNPHQGRDRYKHGVDSPDKHRSDKTRTDSPRKVDTLTHSRVDSPRRREHQQREGKDVNSSQPGQTRPKYQNEEIPDAHARKHSGSSSQSELMQQAVKRDTKEGPRRTLSIQKQDSAEDTLHILKGQYPSKYANKWVQESDGNFFESFTALSWKQENRRRRALSEDDYEAKKPPPLETSILSRAPTKLSREEFEKLYVEVLFTVKHRIGATTGGHLPFMQDLYLYAREAFGVSPEDHARLLARASEEKPPILVLVATVIEARDLEAKDADGFSDPYCMLGIIPGSELAGLPERQSVSGEYSSDEEPTSGKRREGTFKKFSKSFRRAKDNKTAREMIPARYIRTTSVKPNTLNPMWAEKFRFDLDDVQTDRIHLDIWDHDDEFSVVDAAKQLNQVQGFKGLSRYFKQIAQSARTNKQGNVDDFLGSVNLSLHDIPSTGIDDWFDLEGRSSRSNIEGQIRLRLQLATREDKGYSEEDNWMDMQEHEDLICVFIEYELRKFKGEVYQWTGELSQAANTILHQHAIQGDVTDVQQSMCRWRAYSRKHRQHPFDWNLLLRLLEDLDEKWEPASLNRDEEEWLASGFLDFIDYCLNLIQHQREAYPPANKAAQVRLQFLLRCLAKLYDMAVFRRCCPFQKELNLDIEQALKKSNTERYERLRSAIKSTKRDDVVAQLIELTSVLSKDMKQALQYYSPLYQKYLNLPYFTKVYKTTEKLLGNDLGRDLEHVSFMLPECDSDQESGSGNGYSGKGGSGGGTDSFTEQMLGTQLFELYLCLNEFTAFKQHLSSSDVRGLAVGSYYEWYCVPVQRWLNMAKYKAMRRIKKAVDLDKDITEVGEVEGTVKQSTSAIDVSCCFGQVIEFWKSMDWPNHVSGLAFVSKITEDLCLGATYYADLMHEKLRSAGYYDEVGQFDVTEQLCRTINDIELVRRALKPLPETLKYDSIIAAIDEVQGPRYSEKARTDLYGTLHTTDSGMVHKIKQVVDRVADKMRPDIKKFVFHLCWAPEKVPAEEAISELMNYLDNNMLTLNSNLLRSNFDRILDSIWVEVLEEIQDVLNKEEMKAFWFFSRLYDALDILVEFFHANEKGLSMAVLENEPYRFLHRQLSLNKATTAQLVEIFYAERVNEQERTDCSEFGSISVRVYYKEDAETLSVEVLNARNVIPLDPNGLSDPFVMIELCPGHVFSKQTVQQTQIIKKTLNPTFDESFEFSVSTAKCRHSGACITFTVMDHDLFMSNDFAGEAFLCLNDIPGITGEEISGFSALTPISLALTHPKKSTRTSAGLVLDALRIRDDDRVAQEFYKKRKAIDSQSLSKQ